MQIIYRIEKILAPKRKLLQSERSPSELAGPGKVICDYLQHKTNFWIQFNGIQ